MKMLNIKTKIPIIVNLLLITLLVSVSFAQEKFGKSEYAARRAKLMEKISDGVAIILGAPTPATSRHFFQSNAFYYFTGVEIPDAALIIDSNRKESILFFTIAERKAQGDGISVELVKNPKEITGIERVLPIEQFSRNLSRISLQTKNFYTMFKPGEQPRDNTNETFRALQNTMTMNMWDGRLTRELQFVKKLKEKFPYITVMDCSPMVWDLRKIKSTAEIAHIRRAGQIGVKAHLAMIKATRPGAKEKNLAALFEYTCNINGAQEQAYAVIIMSGPNHAFGHYHAYDRILDKKDFIILDAGPDYAYYNADISTTFPASGKFSPRQKEIYELGVGILKVCQQNYRPGTTLKAVGQKVKQHLIEQGYDPNERRFRGLIRYGGYNHSIGMATHDPMGNWGGPDEVLQPGFVFACDINMPYADEELGIRIEDTVVITEDGYENLSKGLPRTVKEIEDFMKR